MAKKWLVYRRFTESHNSNSGWRQNLPFCFKGLFFISGQLINFKLLKINISTNFSYKRCFQFRRSVWARLSGVYRIYAVGKGIKTKVFLTNPLGGNKFLGFKAFPCWITFFLETLRAHRSIKNARSLTCGVS